MRALGQMLAGGGAGAAALARPAPIAGYSAASA